MGLVKTPKENAIQLLNILVVVVVSSDVSNNVNYYMYFVTIARSRASKNGKCDFNIQPVYVTDRSLVGCTRYSVNYYQQCIRYQDANFDEISNHLPKKCL